MSQQKSPKKNIKNNLNTAARLSGSAIQMGIVIYLAVQGGKWLDGHFGTEKVFMPICTILGVAISIYLVIQQLKRINN
ncbi:MULTISPECIES: AtpZ/AtpI family protein [Flagellimonas]|uniref:AtpZ/AtpI family protein n=2 Tax=Flagellimonas TaxID=444459 RepID=A0A3A1NIJ2_9FLAO|nr:MULTISPECIES: AtpZ/AtpI family protein [Allomuricauda]RIV44588.1 AtpZ/AtpI family protein [Allomuricauda maritima]RIV72533.1 AtpZ/AtpI family protein [Allomuricauda aequoris]TXJ94654.1 AtpZ/AtpI family protein [Allomuricauda maritima]TXK05035.1 AtpZ/AtpI family protein [Allomuricauda aequoris]